MLRRISWLIALGLGCAALAWGLFLLHGIFVEEREEALAEVAGRRRALEQFAQQELVQRLAAGLAEARPTIEAAARNPLLPASEMLFFDRGEQILPRRSHPKPDAPAVATKLYTELVDDPDAPEPEVVSPPDPWSERLRLVEALDEALDAGARQDVSRLVRTILAQRAAYVIDITRDLPYALAVLTLLENKASPSRELVEGMLRKGVRGRAAQLEGLERVLLEEVDRFGASDVRFLARRIEALAEPHNVLYTDFSARIDEALARVEAPAEVWGVPDDLTGPALLYEGRWYVEPAGERRTFGIAVDVPSMLEEITGSMRDRGLLTSEDAIGGEVGAATVAVDDLGLEVQSPRWAEAERTARSRYRLKTALEGVIAALVFGVIILGTVIYRRRQRFLELKSDFVSAVSHELRTPLASIRLMAETLERRTKDLPKAKDYPARIVRDVDALGFLVENILSFNRLSRGRWQPNIEPVALSSVVDKLKRDRDGWARKPAELTHDDLEGMVLDADPDLLQLVLTNLARNACQYSERTPARIHLSAQTGEAGVSVLVRDNGVGIDPAEVGRIFEDFYRSRSERRERGSGLGLSICRKIMEAHGGSIRVAETGPEGTTFELRFPRRER